MLHYEFGTEIVNPQPFFDLNRKYFGSYTGSDLMDFRRRLETTKGGIGCAYYDKAPASVLQTMRFSSGGNNDDIPRTSDKLTGGETYENYDIRGNTVVFVTFVVERTLRHMNIDGSNLTDTALERFLSNYNNAEFRITYTPAIKHAVKMHLRHGAKPVIRLPKARPGLVIEDVPAEDVIVMGYKWPRYNLSLLNDFDISGSS